MAAATGLKVTPAHYIFPRSILITDSGEFGTKLNPLPAARPVILLVKQADNLAQEPRGSQGEAGTGRGLRQSPPHIPARPCLADLAQCPVCVW